MDGSACPGAIKDNDIDSRWMRPVRLDVLAYLDFSKIGTVQQQTAQSELKCSIMLK